jgi:hypothetical protein
MTTMNKTVSCTAGRLTKGDLVAFLRELEGQPDNLVISYSGWKGDQLDPSTITLSAILPLTRPGDQSFTAYERP